MKQCPYCNEPHHALKNHVRLSSGGGHGPSGQYPADFDQADETAHERDASGQEDPEPTEPNGGPSAASTSASGGPGGRQSGTVEMTPEEMDQVVETAVDVGREQASTTATQPAQTTEKTAQAARENPREDLDGCPECGAELVDVRNETTLPLGGGQKIRVPAKIDYQCSNPECWESFEWE